MQNIGKEFLYYLWSVYLGIVAGTLISSACSQLSYKVFTEPACSHKSSYILIHCISVLYKRQNQYRMNGKLYFVTWNWIYIIQNSFWKNSAVPNRVLK